MREKLFKDDEFYKVPEIAQKTKISKDVLYGYIRQNKLKAVKVGQRSYRLLGKDLNEFFRYGYKQDIQELETTSK